MEIITLIATGIFVLAFFQMFRHFRRGPKGMVEDVLQLREQLLERMQVECEYCQAKRMKDAAKCPSCGAA